MKKVNKLIYNENIVFVLSFLVTSVLIIILYDSVFFVNLILVTCLLNFIYLLFNKKLSLGFNYGLVLMAFITFLVYLLFLIHEFLTVIDIYLNNIPFLTNHDIHFNIIMVTIYYSQAFLTTSIVVGEIEKRW